ncbi:MAG: metal ABC transporter permease [Velocimicrobium sp.]
MNTIYILLEKILPFSFMQYDFMKNAFLAMLIITPLFGVLGTMIVNNRMAFFSDALGHSAFTGIAIGVILGLMDTSISMVLFAVVFALLLNWIKRRKTVSTDTVISVFSSMGTALGLVVLSRNGQFTKYSNLLVGDILSITPREIALLLAIFVVTIIFWTTCFNSLHGMSINETLAKSKGIKTQILDNCFVVLIALIIMLSIKWVGILIINALLILPAASSRNLASNMREYHRFSIEISLFSGILGLILSYYNNTATGPTIVIVAAIVFFLTLMAKPFVK